MRIAACKEVFVQSSHRKKLLCPQAKLLLSDLRQYGLAVPLVLLSQALSLHEAHLLKELHPYALGVPLEAAYLRDAGVLLPAAAASGLLKFLSTSSPRLEYLLDSASRLQIVIAVL